MCTTTEQAKSVGAKATDYLGQDAYKKMREAGMDAGAADVATAFLNPGGALYRGLTGSKKPSEVEADAAAAQAETDAAALKAEGDRLRATPDLTSAAVQEARRRAVRQLTLGSGRRSTFLTGTSGLTTPKPLSYTSTLGGG